ncbi:hypothetical protein CM19_09460 [Candidatus Acidianus copahuensis]|uniref:UPF0215 protein CM19_09460 n=1 Tax=Candidatus Acidianus copahuensis TaxID=1160895 RepID=A0A031LLH8_9CREN|nr:DUF99 family protein [Candidatus Acidianus copahuensis]EZQ03057.1 hypothetical protein CM19_09460 [Candidatus Acidianus copahuensis]
MLVSGIDDGYFPIKYKKKKGKAPLVISTYSENELVDVDIDWITVDGDDATAVYTTLRKGDIKIFDNIIVGGFNYIIPDKNYIIFLGRTPNISDIKNALVKYFDDSRKKIILEYLSNLIRISTRKGVVYINTDINLSLAKRIIEQYQVFSKYPEPIKTSHIIGKALGQLHVI